MSAPTPAAVGRSLAPGLGVVRAWGVNSYLLREGSSTYLIDSGLIERAPAIVKAIRAAGMRVEDLTHILLTHQHSDHAGGAAFLQWRSDATVACHERDADAVEGKAPRLGPWFARTFFRTHPVAVDRRLKDGDAIGPFTVVHLPGHTPGSVAFYHASRKILFAGDAVVTSRGRATLSSPWATYDRDEAIRSLEKLTKLSIDVLVPGHGEPLTHGVGSALRAAWERFSHLPTPKHWTLAGPEGLPETHPKG